MTTSSVSGIVLWGVDFEAPVGGVQREKKEEGDKHVVGRFEPSSGLSSTFQQTWTECPLDDIISRSPTSPTSLT